jgi:hypothetical protein
MAVFVNDSRKWTSFVGLLCQTLLFMACSTTTRMSASEPVSGEIRGSKVSMTVARPGQDSLHGMAVDLGPDYHIEIKAQRIRVEAGEERIQSDIAVVEGDSIDIDGRRFAKSQVVSIERKKFSWPKTLALVPAVFAGYIFLVFASVFLGMAKFA